MGIDPAQINDAMLKRLDKEARAVVARARGHANAALTSDEAIQRQFRRLERQEQRTLANWLNLQEQAGILVYDWSATHRRVTCRVGMPDFKIYRDGRVLFGEMKIDSGSFSPTQRQMHERLAATGTPVSIWDTADNAVREVRGWLWEHFRVGYEQSQ